MKKILLVLYFLPLFAMAQQTYVPDDNFEQELINLGLDNLLDDYVLTSAIDTLTYLDIINNNINDLTGISDFNSLVVLHCGGNNITSLDLSGNINLFGLSCSGNQLSSLDVSLNTLLTIFICSYNQLTSLNVSNNSNLEYLSFNDNYISAIDLTNNILLTSLSCSNNLLTNINLNNNFNLVTLLCFENSISSLDVSNNTFLSALDCSNNQISSLDLVNNNNITQLRCSSNQIQNLNLSNNPLLSILICSYNQITTLDLSNNPLLEYINCSTNNLYDLDIRNGFNSTTINSFWNLDNPNLTCINVDDSVWSTNNWTIIDSQHYFSNNCSGSTSVNELQNSNKSLLKITDVLGRKTKEKKNTPLFYIYDDGTVEKRIIIE